MRNTACDSLDSCQGKSKRLSSKGTFWHKYGLTTIWVISETVSVIYILAAPAQDHFMIICQYVISTCAVLYCFAGLKCVHIEGDRIRICNYMRSEYISISNISSISQSRILPHKPVTVHFITSTTFGNKIVFMPPIDFRRYKGEHPVVSMLRMAHRMSDKQVKKARCDH